VGARPRISAQDVEAAIRGAEEAGFRVLEVFAYRDCIRLRRQLCEDLGTEGMDLVELELRKTRGPR
jgi:hypothetical protein